MGICYQTIMEESVRVLQSLPIEIPQEGIIAGFVDYRGPGIMEARAHDNRHYPLGTAYLTHGISGIAATAEEKLKKCADERSRALYEGIHAVYLEIAQYFARHAETLNEMILVAADSVDEQARLGIIRDNMTALATRRPSTFGQAVQLVYMMWRLRCLCVGDCACIGRLDVQLYPFYRSDMEQGRLTEEEAFDLICQLWKRINECGSGDTLINVMLGGQDTQGMDETNDLSVLMLRASQSLKKTEPHINVRFHQNTRPDFVEEAYRLQLLGHGQATIYNDEAIIPSLIRNGIPAEIACQYANDGCTEIVFDGLSGIEFNHIDIVAAFELALNNGHLTPKNALAVPYFHRNHDKRPYQPDVILGYESGEADSVDSYDEFYRLFLKQYRYQVERKLEYLCKLHEEMKGWESSIILNGTFDTVLESGKDLAGGGLPIDDLMTFMGSIPTAADCLMAVKRVVFEEKKTDIPTLKKALAANFVGYEWLRAALLNAPKFGNDVDEVDLIAADIARHACDWTDEYSKKRGVRIFAALVGWRFLEEAYGVGATPDGRKYADPIAEHYCATPGRAVNGPTALINSITKADLSRACGVAATHISLPASVSQDEEAGLRLLRTLTSVALQRQIVMLNTALYDVEALKKAQIFPEKYPDLIVRVWGFSARFVDLSREMQDHVIRRVLSQGV